jgi:putative hemolysin
MRRVLMFVLCAVLLVGGCGDDVDDADTQIPNPASVFCEQSGGIVRMETDEDGSETGICVLADGTEVDEWEYYRANSPDTTTG